MKDIRKTKAQLVEELAELRQRIAQYEAAESQPEPALPGFALSQQETSDVLDKMAELVIFHDRDLRVIWVNQAAADSLGLAQKDLVGSHCYELWHKRSAPCDDCPIAKTFENGKAHDIRFTTGDGRHWLGHAYPVRLDGGDLRGVIQVVQDITDRSQAEATLRARDEHLRVVVENVPVTLFALDRNGVFTFSQGPEYPVDVKPADFLGQSVLDFFSFLPIKEPYERVFSGEEVTEVFDLYGYSFEVRVSPLRDQDDTIIGAIGIALDVTERKQTEAALKANEEHLRIVVDNLPITFFTLDLAGTITFVRGPVYAPGMTTADFLGAPAIDMFEEFSARERFDQILAGKEVTELIEVFGFWLEVRASALRDHDGAIIGVIGTAINVTERKQAEQVLAKRNQALLSLHEGTLEIAGELDVPTVLRSIMKRAADLLDADQGGAVFIYEPENQVLRLTEAIGIDESRLGETVAPGRGATGHVFQSRRPLIINDYSAWEGAVRAKPIDPPSAVLGVPLYQKDQPVGVLILIATAHRRVFDQQDAQLAAMFAAQAAIAYRNAQLYAEAQQEISERKQTEIALRESEEKYRSLADNSLHGIFVSDLEKVLYVNQRLCEISGYSANELMAMHNPIEQLFVTEDLERIWASARELLTEGSVFPHYEVRGIRKGGQVIPLDLTASAITRDGKRVIQGTIQDVSRRKRAEAALLAREEHLRVIIDNVPITLFTTDRDGVITFVQGPDYPIDVAPDDFTGLPILDYFPDLPLEDLLGRILAGEEITQVVEVFDSWFEMRASPLRDRKGAIIGVIGIAIDISERKRAERERHEVDQRYRSIFERNNDGIFIVGLDGAIQDANQRGVKMLGYDTVEDLIGKTADDVVAPDEVADQRARLATIMKGEIQPVYERNGLRKDGTIFPAEISGALAYDLDGNPSHLHTIVRDISERKQAEKERFAANQQYRSIFERNNDGIFMVGLDGTIKDANQRGAEMVGYDSVDDLIGLPAHAVIDPGEVSDQQDRIATILNGQLQPPYERILRRKDGSTLPADISAALAYDAEGKPSHIHSIVRDISERKRVEQRNLELKIEQERVQILSGFITQASHEFRTPLSIINTSAYLLDKITGTDESGEYARRIEAQVADIETLIADLTTMSQLDGGVPFVLAEMDLGEVIESVADKLRPAIREKDQKFIVELEHRPMIVRGDVEYLALALMRIVENATRFTPAGGTITVRANRVDDQVIVEITDTGPGIAPDTLPHIFERFYRSDTVGTTRGFGLGLPIARAIVEGHQGQVEAESVENQGSTFRVLLPAKHSP